MGPHPMKRNGSLYLNNIIGLNVVWNLNKGKEVEANYANIFVLGLLIRNDLTHFSQNPRYDNSHLNLTREYISILQLTYDMHT